MTNWFARLVYKYPFLANVATLSFGIAISQAIPFIASPLLTRLYSPSDFGELSLFMSIVTLLTAVACGRYELTIVLTKNDKDATTALFLSISLAVLTAFLSLALIICFWNTLSKYLSINITQIYLVPIAVIVISISQAFSYLSTKKKQYSLLSIARISNSLITAITAVIAGLIHKTSLGLVLGTICGYSTALAVLSQHYFIKEKINSCSVTFLNLKDHAIKYVEYLKFNTLHALSDIVQSSGIVFLVGYFYGNETLGYYSFAARIILAPGFVIAAAFSQVFFQKASAVHAENGNLHKLFIKSFRMLFFISLPVFLLIGFGARPLFSLMFGKNWATAGLFAQTLAPWAFAKFLASPLSFIPVVLGKPKKAFAIGFFYNLTALGVVWLASIMSSNPLLAMLSLAMVMCLFTAYQLAWYNRICKNFELQGA